MARRNRIQFTPQGDNRRKPKKDWVSAFVTLSSGIGWVGAFVIVLMLDRASPARETFWDRITGNPVRSYWNTQMLRWSLAVIIVVFAICLIGLACNGARMSRKGDRIYPPLVVLTVLCGLGIGIFLLRFGSML